ncbi:MAG: hypothetical protein RLZZ08_128 [Pseudomonadota bacterium]|jgi:glycosyltransferase involved in cell wall biosynthesis
MSVLPLRQSFRERPVPVDVVIPTYNRAGLLPHALASIQRQSLRVGRIIVVDDGSTDGTVDWVAGAAAADPRIQLVQRQHGGANRARNAGIALAQSDWIAFLDSDDEWEADKLERQFALLRDRPDLVGLFTGSRLVGGRAERVHVPRDNPTEQHLRRANTLGSTSTAVLRASAVGAIGGFDESLPSCQDWDLWFRLRQVGPLGVVRHPLVRFNNGPHERITTDADRVLNGHRIMFDLLMQGLANPADRAAVQAGHRLVEAEIRRRFGSYGPALELAVRSFLQRPSRWALALSWRIARDAMTRPVAPAAAEKAKA